MRPGQRHTEEAKAKIAAARRGRKHSEETKAKISQSAHYSQQLRREREVWGRVDDLFED